MHAMCYLVSALPSLLKGKDRRIDVPPCIMNMKNKIQNIRDGHHLNSKHWQD